MEYNLKCTQSTFQLIHLLDDSVVKENAAAVLNCCIIAHVVRKHPNISLCVSLKGMGIF